MTHRSRGITYWKSGRGRDQLSRWAIPGALWVGATGLLGWSTRRCTPEQVAARWGLWMTAGATVASAWAFFACESDRRVDSALDGLARSVDGPFAQAINSAPVTQLHARRPG